MKILHINSYYSSSLFYKNLFEYQVEDGLDINVFVPVSSAIGIDKDFGYYTKISNNYNKYDRFIFHLKQNKIYNDLVNTYDINNFSLVHAHSLFTNGYVAMKLKKDFGIPYIVAVRNTDVNIFFKKMIYLRNIGHKILENADRVIFLSESYKKEVIERYAPKGIKQKIYDKSVVIPNGIDEFWFDNLVSIKQKPNKSFLRLLQIGDINKNKNIETTIKAVELLIKKGYKAKLDVVGKIKDQNVYEQIKDAEFVKYLGFKRKEELINIYRNNDIFVLPSKHETFGLVYAEAMSQGLPVIYTKGQGFDGQFPDGEVGFSVDCFNPNDIANRIIEVIQNYSNISIECVRKVGRFKWSYISEKYKEIYLQILMGYGL